jgi:hypothetical protein
MKIQNFLEFPGKVQSLLGTDMSTEMLDWMHKFCGVLLFSLQLLSNK